MTRGKWFSDQPIPVKLGLINLMTVMAALFPVICITLGYEYYSVRRETLQEAEVQANIIRDNVSAAAAFADTESARETLQALRSSPNVVQAALFLPNGSELARYVAPASALRPISGEKKFHVDSLLIQGRYIRIGRVVHLKQDAVGWLVVETSMQPLLERLGLYLVVNFLSTVLGFVIAYPLSKKLKESITAPLSDLMALARHVTTHQDYTRSPRANDSNDEV